MSIKNEVNHAIFRSMLPSIKTERESQNHIIYGVVDEKSNQTIKFHWVDDPELTDGPVITIVYNGDSSLSEYGLKHYNKILDKLKKIEGLSINIEDLTKPILTDEQSKALDEICVENGIDVESLNNDDSED
ncbi:hypothetical protein J6W34_01030 [bacterium]|nr:hypothetical protein [bacterium]